MKCFGNVCSVVVVQCLCMCGFVGWTHHSSDLAIDLSDHLPDLVESGEKTPS